MDMLGVYCLFLTFNGSFMVDFTVVDTFSRLRHWWAEPLDQYGVSGTHPVWEFLDFFLNGLMLSGVCKLLLITSAKTLEFGK